MPGPLPKAPGLRQRRNRATTHATLPSAAEAANNKVPKLYEREKSSEKWHERVVAWWKAAWKSPMASEWQEAEQIGLLYRLAEMLQMFWSSDDADLRVKLEGKIRQAEIELGLTPMGRRRLQWEVEKGEEAHERTTRRRARKSVEGKDPREILKAVR